MSAKLDRGGGDGGGGSVNFRSGGDTLGPLWVVETIETAHSGRNWESRCVVPCIVVHGESRSVVICRIRRSVVVSVSAVDSVRGSGSSNGSARGGRNSGCQVRVVQTMEIASGISRSGGAGDNTIHNRDDITESHEI